jgi:cytoskeletal protein RodZ
MATIGEILRSKREEQKLSIEEVAQETQIRSKVLKAIEEENFDVLPATYMKSFVKKYAIFLQVDQKSIEEMVSSAFESLVTNAPKRQMSAPPLHTSKSSSFSVILQSVGDNAKIISAVVVFIALVALLYGIFAIQNSADETLQDGNTLVQSSTGTLSNKSVNDSAADKTTLLSVLADEEEDATVFALADSLVLQARATGEIWISIVSDGKKSSQMTMQPSTTQRWTADSSFTITLGDGGAAEFYLNGQPLQAFAKKGTVVRNIRITRTLITISGIGYPIEDRILRPEVE